MEERKADIGVVGLAVMGQNLGLNMAEKGFCVALWNRTYAKVEECAARARQEKNLPVIPCATINEFVKSLRPPRKIVLMIQAGKPVDEMLKLLIPLLQAGDLVIDGGNEWFQNTETREELCRQSQLRYIGMGVSGGEEGARKGPSLMPGGSRDGFDLVKDILTKVAAQVDGKPCMSYIGPGGSGNYVKMIHNGIEYGDMQLIAEAYDLLRKVAGLTNEEMSRIFCEWNKGDLKSFLIEITSAILLKKDDMKSEKCLVDCVLDVASSKGTGKWTVQEAAERSCPCPTVQAALDVRNISAFEQMRKKMRDRYAALHRSKASLASPVQKPDFVDAVRNALYCGKVCSYAQGLTLLKQMSDDRKWGLNLGEIARTWKGGCIIRAQLLDQIKNAFETNPDLESLLLDEKFSTEILSRLESWKRVICEAITHNVAVPALSSSFAYFSCVTSEKLPMNLVQAQRDFFGAHTFRRVDMPGSFHAEWSSL